jgi:hypothetical protein
MQRRRIFQISLKEHTTGEELTHIARIKWMDDLASRAPEQTVQGAIADIEVGAAYYYSTGAHGDLPEVAVTVGWTALGVKYLRTNGNETTRDNLLDLPRF